MKKRFLTCALLLSLLSFSGVAQEWDVSKIQDFHRWTFRISKAGEPLGETRWELRRMGDQVLLSEESNIPSLQEDIFLWVNGATLKPDSILVTGRMSGFPIECKSSWSENSVRGYAHFPKHPSRPMISIDQELPETTKVRFASFILSPFYKDLKVGSSFNYPQFSSTDNQLRTITANVTAEEVVVVNGTEVKALKLELSGGAAEQNIYVDVKRRRVVKISFRDIDFTYELISD